MLMGMSKYDRLLYILNLLRSRRNLNAAMIAKECGVTERSIYRDIATLSEANIPIYYDNGYKFASKNFLPPLNFTINEYFALKTALESSPLYKSDPQKKVIKSLRSKIDACLNAGVKKEISTSSNVTKVDIKKTFDSKSIELYFPVIESAIIENKLLIMDYASLENGLSRRTVEPYFIIFRVRAFYFVGYCKERKALRTFRIDRIKSLEKSHEHFKPRRGVDSEEYFKDSWGVFSGDPVDIEVVFKGKAAGVVSSGQHHEGEKITDLGNGLIKYEVTVAGIEEICHWLLGFGGEIEVVSPVSLRSEIRKRARALIKSNK